MLCNNSIRVPFSLCTLIACVVCLLLIGCSRSSSNAPSTANAKSKQTTQDKIEDQRFAVFSPAIGVMLRDLGFEDAIVGRHAYDNALSTTIPVIGSHLDIDYELLITLNPTDLFFERNTIVIPDRLTALATEHGWTIWTYQLNTLDDIATTMDDLYLKLVGFPDQLVDTKDPFDLPIDPSARLDIELPSARLAQSWSTMGRVAKSAGRVLVLAGVDPMGAMGPGSFHGQLIERMGISPAIVQGGMWQELDYEDLIELAPDSIIVLSPKAVRAMDLIGEPQGFSWDQIRDRVGAIADLPIPASMNHRIAIIEDPLGLLPSSSLAQIADQIATIVRNWDAIDAPNSESP